MAKTKKKQAAPKKNKVTLTGEPVSPIEIPNKVDPVPTVNFKQDKRLVVRESNNLLAEYVFGHHTREDGMNPYSLSGVKIGAPRDFTTEPLYGNTDPVKRARAYRKIFYKLHTD